MKNWLRQIPIAHRGLHDGRHIPENSIAAFRAAADRGFAIELDIQQLADGNIVVFHDECLARATGTAGLLSDATKEQVSDLRLFETDEPIPLLPQVLELVAGKVPLLIEVKRYRSTKPFENELAHLLASYNGPFAVMSFSANLVSWFRHQRPDFCRGLVCECLQELPEEALRSCKPHFMACSSSRLPLSDSSIPVLVWTVRSEAEHRAHSGLADNIIFEGFIPGSEHSQCSADENNDEPRNP